MKRAALFVLLSAGCSGASDDLVDRNPIEAGPFDPERPRGDGGVISPGRPDGGTSNDAGPQPVDAGPRPVIDGSAPEVDGGTTSDGGPVDDPERGSLRVITYNVAGLPDILSSSEPAVNTPMIGPLLKDFDLIHVQEDFNYHAELYAGDNHPFRSETSGGVPFGDGLNTLSNSEFFEFERTKWGKCNGTDCLTPKGFTYARHRLAQGVYLDVYNAHPNASVAEPDLEARRANMTQLAAYIDTHSMGNAVLVMADTNTRYTRAGDNVRELTSRGFRDPWLDLVRRGDVPVQGADALTACAPSYNSKDCEIVDKVFYRSSRMLHLSARSHRVEDQRFVRADGVQLSDHYPVIVELDYELAPDVRASDLVGGAGGAPFNDLAGLGDRPVVKAISLRGSERFDGLTVTYDDKSMIQHGGVGGDESTLELASADTLRRAELCTAEHEGSQRLFFVALESEAGARVEAGTRSDTCVSYEAPASFAITGFYGRAGDEIDRLGVLFTRNR